VSRLQEETTRALDAQAVKGRLLAQGAIPSDMTSKDFGALIANETKKWAEVVKVAGATVD
jgi:tripartite-type tricarboxylate transporter receptor subunit TctC